MVGLGNWGPNLLRNFRENPACRVTALCDANAARLAEFRALLPDAAHVTDIAQVAALPVEAVVVATPAGFHAAQVRLLLEAGKDVFVEKPLALSLGEARALVRRARELGRVLMVGHTFLFNPAVLRAGELLDAGMLGRLKVILAQRLSLGHIREDVNALWNLAPHDISILLHWLKAMPTRVWAHGGAFFPGQVQEDLALCHLEFPGGIHASVQVSWLAPVKVRAMTLVGTERMLVYDDVNTERPLLLYHKGASEVPRTLPDGSLAGYRLQVRQGAEEPVAVDWREPLAVEAAHFLDCVRSRREPTGAGAMALQVTSTLEALDRSLKAGGAAVEPEPID